MKYEQVLNEVIFAELANNPRLLKQTKSLWSKLVDANKVSIYDESSFMNFQSFVKSFFRKNNKIPSYTDVLKFTKTGL